MDQDAVDQDKAWYDQVDHVNPANKVEMDHASGKSGLFWIMSTDYPESWYITNYGTHRTWCSYHWFHNDRIAVVEVPVKFQNDWKSLNPNIAASRLHEILG